MKNVVTHLILLLFALLLVGCGQRSGTSEAPTDVDMSVQAEPHPLSVGDTTLFVTLADSNGEPIDGAALQVHGNMDHEGMTPVDREVSESTNGEYRVPFEWTMGGGWIVTVTAELPDNRGKLSKEFEFFVEAISSSSIVNRHSGMSDDSLPVRMTYTPDHDPAFGGDAVVTISLLDTAGVPVTDAAVEIRGDMSHAGMMPVSGTGEHTENGVYAVPIRWTMAGDWNVTVIVTLADGTVIEKTFDQQVVLRNG